MVEELTENIQHWIEALSGFATLWNALIGRRCAFSILFLFPAGLNSDVIAGTGAEILELQVADSWTMRQKALGRAWWSRRVRISLHSREKEIHFCLIHCLLSCHLLPSLILPIWMSSFYVKEDIFFVHQIVKNSCLITIFFIHQIVI